MDYAEIKTYVSDKGGRLVGYYPISFPVYGVHVTYDSIDNDPFFPIYRALLKYTELDPHHKNLSYFSHMIGFERTMLEDCRRKLRDDAMIKFIGDKWVITDNARSKYLQSGNRSTVRVSGTFLVDGKDLSFLPDVVYSNPFKLNRWSKSDTATHKPIDMSLSTAPAEMIADQLERRPNIRHTLRIDTVGSNFSVIDFDKQFITGLTLVFYIDKEKRVQKEPLYCGQPVACAAIGDVSGYSIDMKVNDKGKYIFKSNIGYNVSSAEDASKTILFSKTEGWNQLIALRYDLPDSIPVCIEIEENTNLPIIVIDNMLADNAGNLRPLVDDAINGYIDYPVQSEGKICVAVSNNVDEYVSLYKEVTEWISNPKILALEFSHNLENKYSNWRKTLVRLGMYDELEKIDSECFIKNR